MEAKSFFLFNVGSWWVYEEETSHLRDSLFVVVSQNDTETPDYNVEIVSELDGYSYFYHPVYVEVGNCKNYNAAVDERCVVVEREKGKIGDYIGTSRCFYIQYKIGSEFGNPNSSSAQNKIQIADIYDTYQLNTLTFGRTVKVHEMWNLLEGEQETNHFYSKNIGLIRKELIDSNQVWNLVSYHIQ